MTSRINQDDDCAKRSCLCVRDQQRGAQSHRPTRNRNRNRNRGGEGSRVKGNVRANVGVSSFPCSCVCACSHASHNTSSHCTLQHVARCHVRGSHHLSRLAAGCLFEPCMASADEHGIMYTRRTYMMWHITVESHGSPARPCRRSIHVQTCGRCYPHAVINRNRHEGNDQTQQQQRPSFPSLIQRARQIARSVIRGIVPQSRR
jgi:hypothetical protein